MPSTAKHKVDGFPVHATVLVAPTDFTAHEVLSGDPDDHTTPSPTATQRFVCGHDTEAMMMSWFCVVSGVHIELPVGFDELRMYPYSPTATHIVVDADDTASSVSLNSPT